ncbi:hypothetical protein ABT173_15065, partial [Streptomyces sp. NPDC001795]
MRRSARVLSAAALAGAALGAVAPPAFADPSADVSPRSAAPGGEVTVSVTCDAVSGALPEFIEAVSQGFEGGKVRLNRADGNGGRGEGTAGRAGGVAGRRRATTGVRYSGTARIPADGPVDTVAGLAGREAEWGVEGRCPVAPGSREMPWKASFSVSRDGSTRPGESPGKLQGEAEGRQETPGREDAP